jgi:hypothetical protein
MGRTGKGKANIVSRMEKGSVSFPSLSLVADFLRGCRAGFKDILDILDFYTDLPTTQQKVFSRALAKVAASVPQKWQSQVEDYDRHFEHPKAAPKPGAEQPMPDRAARLVRARKMAAAARRRFLYGQFLKDEVGKAGPHLSMIDKTALFNHGLEWFSILYDTRRKRPATRDPRLAASEAAFAEASRLPLEVIRYVQDAVKQHFGEMEMRGDLDWLPDLSLDEYEARLLAPTRKRSQSQQQLDEFRRKLVAYDAARHAAVEQVWSEVQPALDAAGVPKERRAVYRGVVTACFTAATQFEPGSVGETKQVDERVLDANSIRLGLDTALARKLAAVALARFRELAESFPPNPRPRR